MIELIHRHPIAIRVLLGVVTLTFVLTGGWMLGKESKTDYAAKVGDMKITMTEYQDAYYKTQEFYRKAFQGNFPPDLEKKLNLNKKALDALIDRKLILVAAEKGNIKVTDKEVIESVTGNKNFQDETGRFSESRYRDLLKYNHLTPPVYEQGLRDDLTVEKFRKMVKDSVYVTDNELRDSYKKQMESQKKEFKEADFQAQKENQFRMQTVLEQEKTMNSFMEGLRGGYKIEINPNIASAAS